MVDQLIIFCLVVAGIFGFFGITAWIGDQWLAHCDRRDRDQARAQARAERMEGADRSDASHSFSWQD